MPPDLFNFGASPQTADRYSNGVRVRRDGKGDAWANTHRLKLGKQYYMEDWDTFFGCHVFGANTGNRLFLEYEPDDFSNSGKLIRDFAFVAMFERKLTEQAAFNVSNPVGAAAYLDVCRKLSDFQPDPMRFFFCIGGQTPPWRIIEICTKTGNRIGNESEIDENNFRTVWDAIGLTDLRNTLRRYVLSRK